MPGWLGARMARLGRVLTEALVLEYGRDEVLRRLAHPFWFQSLGCVMGMDWHSSGITTSVIGALKRGLAPVADELGLHVCGGRGRHSRRTPEELAEVSERTGQDADALARASRLIAKVDNNAVQDGFQIYLHAFIVTDDGKWVVVQQGMATERRQARRYHWLSEGLSSFVDAPHAAVLGPNQGTIVNLTDARAAPARRAQVDLVHAGPDRTVRTLLTTPHLVMPDHHDVRPANVVPRRLWGTLAAAADHGPESFEDLLLERGVGARTVAALALASEIIYGTPSRFTDPARFSFAHGGKDGHPYPVPLQVYDRTLRVMTRAVQAARLGQDDKLTALRTLEHHTRVVELAAEKGPPVEEIIARERRDSHRYGGRTVFGRARPPASTQLSLPGL